MQKLSHEWACPGSVSHKAEGESNPGHRVMSRPLCPKGHFQVHEKDNLFKSGTCLAGIQPAAKTSKSYLSQICFVFKWKKTAKIYSKLLSSLRPFAVNLSSNKMFLFEMRNFEVVFFFRSKAEQNVHCCAFSHFNDTNKTVTC